MPMPAFAQSTSIGPRPLSTSRTIASTESASETSPTTASPPISVATASTCSRVRAETATRAPADASSRAMFAPIPRPPPVTSAICPSSSGKALDLLQRLRVLERREIARILADRFRAYRAPDDLRTPRFRQRADPDDSLRLERLAQVGDDCLRDAFRVGIGTGLRDAEEPRGLALDLVRDPHRRGLGDET